MTERPLIAPSIGQIVRVRTRTYLVEDIIAGSGHGTTARLACLDDDAQGQELDVVWELELDRQILDEEAWKSLGGKGFDDPRFFSAYIHTLRWNCITATDPKLFQAPFRAGIRIDAYQLEPLRKALLLPRVNLFIADDVGLGKTIEAGLVASELLLRRRVKEIVVSCPPSMLLQWKDELESRFGLVFEVLDRAYLERVRQERGFSVNPWNTFPRFLISHKLLIDETYAAPLRDWLDNLRPGSLFILDEAHHAAPASGSRYAIDSKITRAIRDLANRFEHRLFLSATPHNGHSNSFSALLELLDPQRFTRGVKVVKEHLNQVMVRRLKEDIREVSNGGGFPKREVVQIDIKGLPEDAPELTLARLLDEYRTVRQLRLADATKRQQNEGMLLISGLQQRLLSSMEAFARTLSVHRRTMERVWQKDAALLKPTPSPSSQVSLLVDGLDSDDDRAQLAETDLQALEDASITTTTEQTAGDSLKANVAREKELLSQMASVAEQGRGRPDARIRHLIAWIRENMCPGARLPGEQSSQNGAPWTDLRLLIFTEYEDTKRYLVNMLQAAIAGTSRDGQRIEVFHGPTPPEKREAIKRAFMEHPSKNPLRILVATDAAREGLNLQAHCHHLFHFDVPWNPSRLEQRNGRIDRKLQPSPVVYCHYFVYAQRPEDRVLRALVRKTETIRKELGSLAQVLESRLALNLRAGIRQADAAALEVSIDTESLDPENRKVSEEEFEIVRERQDDLRRQINTLGHRIKDARDWIGLDNSQLRDALSCSLEMMGAQPLAVATGTTDGPQGYVFPNLETRYGADATWSSTLDTLRAPPHEGPRDYRWRREAPIRPVIFDAPETVDENTVQLHLEHRVVRRLLGRFMSQGFVHHDLSRACLAQSEDSIPRVALIGRLSVYGPGAARLHEEILTVTARWSDLASRKGPLTPYARDAEARTLALLEQSLKPGASSSVPDATSQQLLASLTADIADLLPHLDKRGHEAKVEAEKRLLERGQAEADSLRRILEEQKKRVLAQMGRYDEDQLLLRLDDEREQLKSNRRYWDRWLENVELDLQREPGRILDFYRTASFRLEPVGIAYLWPVTH